MRSLTPTQAALFALAALGCAAGFLVVSVDSLINTDPEDYRNTILLAPWALAMVALTGIHLAQRQNGGRAERWGYRAVIAFMAFDGIGLALFASGIEAGKYIEGAGILPWIVGMVFLGIGTVRAGIFPKHIGWAIALTQPLTMAAGLAFSPYAGLHDHGAYTGAIVHAVTFSALALALYRLPRGEVPHGALATA